MEIDGTLVFGYSYDTDEPRLRAAQGRWPDVAEDHDAIETASRS